MCSSEHGVIDYFIENLTGIKNSQVKNAPKLEETRDELRLNRKVTSMTDWMMLLIQDI